MARPRKEDHARLTKRLPSPRCTESEYKVVFENASKAGLSVTEYIRRQCLKGKVVVRRVDAKSDFELVNQLRKIGVNVNQIAKNLNIFGDPATADQKRVWLKLEKVLDHLINKM